MSQQPSPGAQTIVDERTQERPDFRVEEGDHERFSHYVPKEKLTEAMVLGTPVVALCGKVWVPSRDPERFPVCPECQEIWQGLTPGGDENYGRVSSCSGRPAGPSRWTWPARSRS